MLHEGKRQFIRGSCVTRWLAPVIAFPAAILPDSNLAEVIMVTRAEVVDAFRLLLGRDPENVATVEAFMRVPDWANLREIFLASDEFKTKLKLKNIKAAAETAPNFIHAPPNAVDVEISPAHFGQLIKHVQNSWESLGKKQPHWSVLTDARFLPENIEANVDNFYDTGDGSLRILEMAAARAGKELPPALTCFELGCGVGRVTAALAGKFKQVVAADISQPHLSLAGAHLLKRHIDNVTIVQLKSLSTLESIMHFDVFYSIIVLQHNPPPLIYRMLQLIFEKVNHNGFVYFQVPVSQLNYSFSIERYMESMKKNETSMEMHTLPQTYLFRVLDEYGFRILDFQRDDYAGPRFHSVTIFAEKK
jgi:2-polyprenyl-3-methyl-5-hydroxy-6-metoxy-1,4-benzoquinol methylase